MTDLRSDPIKVPAQMFCPQIYRRSTILREVYFCKIPDTTLILVLSTPAQTYVESNITCEVINTTQNCQVSAQSLFSLPHSGSEITLLSSQRTVQAFSSLLPNANPPSNPLDETDETDDKTLRYMFPDPTVSEDLVPSLDYSLPLDTFSIRFAQIIFHASMENATRYITRDISILRIMATTVSTLTTAISFRPIKTYHSCVQLRILVQLLQQDSKPSQSLQQRKC